MTEDNHSRTLKRNGIIDFNQFSRDITEDNILTTEDNNLVEDKILTKIQNDLINNGWNELNEKVLKAICKNSLEYKHLHEKYSYNYKLFNKVLSILLLIFTTGLSADTTFNISDNNRLILNRVITYGSTLLTLILNFVKAEESSASHFTSSISFGELYNNTLQQSCLTRTSRKNGVNYINEILEKYNNIISTSPSVKMSSDDELNYLNETHKDRGVIINISEQSNKNNTPTQINTNLSIIQKCINESQDIPDKDMMEMTHLQLKNIKTKISNVRLDYEKDRMLQHSSEND